MATRRWRAIYEEWRYWNPELLPHECGRIVRGCYGKLAYPDFLTALMAVEAKARDGYSPETLTLYCCDICRHTHIGNMRTSPAILVDQQWIHYPLPEGA